MISVDLFLTRGFDGVTVEQIADAAEVSPVSVYRWFETKEGIVLWDEFDPPMLDLMSRLLESTPPLMAIRRTLAQLLDEIYDTERELVLARAQLIHREPRLLAAAHLSNREFQGAVASLLAGHFPPLAADTMAAAVIAALTVAVDHWQRGDGAEPLADLIDSAFSALASV